MQRKKANINAQKLLIWYKSSQSASIHAIAFV